MRPDELEACRASRATGPEGQRRRQSASSAVRAGRPGIGQRHQLQAGTNSCACRWRPSHRPQRGVLARDRHGTHDLAHVRELAEHVAAPARPVSEMVGVGVELVRPGVESGAHCPRWRRLGRDDVEQADRGTACRRSARHNPRNGWRCSRRRRSGSGSRRSRRRGTCSTCGPIVASELTLARRSKSGAAHAHGGGATNPGQGPRSPRTEPRRASVPSGTSSRNRAARQAAGRAARPAGRSAAPRC